jgi:hypothetical protein
MGNFRPVDRDTGFLMPPSVDEWLPERQLARFVVEVIAGLDLRAMTGDYRGPWGGLLPSQRSTGAARLRLCHCCVFQPETGAGDL